MSVRIACFLPLRTRPIATPRDVLAQRHAGIHERERRAADRRHRRRTVGLEHFADQAQRVGELIRGGSIGTSARSARWPWPISRRPGAAHRAGLADRERREVVVVHVALVRNREDPVDALLVADRAERRSGEDLRLAAGEDAGAVHARHVVHLRPDRRISSGLRPSGRILSSTTMVRSSSSSMALMIFSKSLLTLLSISGRTSRHPSCRASRSRLRARVCRTRVAFGLLGDAHRVGDFFVEVLVDRRIEPALLSSGYSRFALPAFFASSSIALTIFLISSCANATAPRNSSSEISLAPPSTIITASDVPATTMSIPPVSYCRASG